MVHPSNNNHQTMLPRTKDLLKPLTNLMEEAVMTSSSQTAHWDLGQVIATVKVRLLIPCVL